MKIYNKSVFALGLFCAGGALLFAFGVLEAEWWQWVLTIAAACRCLYVGLSETARNSL